MVTVAAGKLSRRLVIASLLVSGAASPAPAGESGWPRFRGPDGGGLAQADDIPPLDLATNLRWKVECKAGASSPIAIGGRVFYTSFDGDDRLVICLSAVDGAVKWTKTIRAERKEATTPPGGPANPTPAADDDQIYAFFPDAGLFCWSHDGDERWHVELGPFQSFHGIAASLVVVEEQVIVQADQLEDSFLAAFDRRTGDETWRVERFDGPLGGYSTPATRVTAAGKTELVVSGPSEVVGYDAATGTRHWAVPGASNAPISVPVVHGNRVFVCEPSFSENPFKIDSLLVHDKDKDGALSLEEVAADPRMHRAARRIDNGWGNGDGKVEGAELESAFKNFVGGGGLVAIQLDEALDAVNASVSWTYRKEVPQIPSLVLVDGTLFFINDGGILVSVDPATGEILKRGRLTHGGSFYASPVAAGDKILLIDTRGTMSVVRAKAEWEIIATNQLGESCHATPAVADGCVYIRGESSLFCFGDAGN
jgi:outer membrane protein assembly factor BamB